MTNSTTDGRVLFHWRPPNLHEHVVSAQKNDDRLADTIAEAVPRLFTRPGGSLVYLNDDGQIVGVTPTRLVEIIAAHIATVTLVPRNGAWQREYRSFEFKPKQRFNPTSERPTEPPETEPDSKVLMDLFSNKLPLRLPRCVE